MRVCLCVCVSVSQSEAPLSTTLQVHEEEVLHEIITVLEHLTGMRSIIILLVKYLYKNKI